MIATLTITLNNQAITIRPSQLFDKFGHYNFDRETQKSTKSSTPCYPDQAIIYELTAGRIPRSLHYMIAPWIIFHVNIRVC
jgi:hypothetical protein